MNALFLSDALGLAVLGMQGAVFEVSGLLRFTPETLWKAIWPLLFGSLLAWVLHVWRAAKQARGDRSPRRAESPQATGRFSGTIVRGRASLAHGENWLRNMPTAGFLLLLAVVVLVSLLGLPA
jgi:hypothetical protein